MPRNNLLDRQPIEKWGIFRFGRNIHEGRRIRLNQLNADANFDSSRVVV